MQSGLIMLCMCTVRDGGDLSVAYRSRKTAKCFKWTQKSSSAMSKTPPPGAIDYEAACALLGLPSTPDPHDIDDDQLKKAFRKAALKAHPDKGGSDDAFRKVKAANEHYKVEKEDSLEAILLALHLPGDEVAFIFIQ